MKIARRLVYQLIIFTLVFSVMMPFKAKNAAAAQPILVTIDGQKVSFDVQPVIEKDRVLVPFRAIFESFGATVNYNSDAKTITSTRNGQEIKFTLNSKVATVNGRQVQMDVQPTIIKDRTLVPLRFIGENFNGQVDWENTTKHVKIVTNVEKLPEKEVSVYLNNALLSFDVPPINKNNKVYVPFRSFLPQMGDDVQYERNGKEIFIDMEGAAITVFIGEDYAFLNGSYVSTSDSLIEENGLVYAPIRFITNLFGGSVQVSPGAGEIRMLINRTNLRSKYLEKENVQIVRPTNVQSASFDGNRRLMVSDNPEILNKNTIPARNATLWEDYVYTQEASMDHRVYGWHVNKLGRNVKIGITIENLSQTNEIEISNIKGLDRASSNSSSVYDVGLPLSEALLSEKLANIKMDNPIVKANEIAVINAFGVNNEFLIGFLKDFTVKRSSGTGNLSYKVRVVLTDSNGDLTEIKTDPVQTDKINSHPRGVWSSSQLLTELPVYYAGSPEVAYSISNGDTDNLLSAENSLGNSSNEVMKNPGHYGATYRVKIPIINNTGEAKTVRVRLGARGGDYNGVIKVDGKVYMIPVLKPAVEVANVIDYLVDGSKGEIELKIMHSGGSALPLAIDLITID